MVWGLGVKGLVRRGLGLMVEGVSRFREQILHGFGPLKHCASTVSSGEGDEEVLRLSHVCGLGFLGSRLRVSAGTNSTMHEASSLLCFLQRWPATCGVCFQHLSRPLTFTVSICA